MQTFGFYRKVKSKWELVASCEAETLNSAGKIFAAQGLNQWQDGVQVSWRAVMEKQKNFRPTK